MENRIPGGLIDKGTEFFSVRIGDTMEPYCNHSGGTYDFHSTPDNLKEIMRHSMKAMPVVEKAIESMVGVDESAKLKKFITCRFGALNTEADIDSDGIVSEAEYVPCHMRGKCAYEGIVCTSIMFRQGVFLTKSETEVFKLVRFPDKIIAAELFISVETVKTHFQNIRQKTGLTGKIEMAIWATQKGII